MSDESHADAHRHVLLALYDSDAAAQRALDRLIEHGFPLDRVSMLGQASASGDDPLGIYYTNAGDRMKGWGRMGALWGGLFGLVGGAVGMFVVPGVGPLIAAGPLAESLIGAAAGAGVGGGAMVGGAALSELGIAIHRMGVPEDHIERIQDMLRDGRYLLLLILDRSEAPEWRERLARTGADPLWDHPYVGWREAVAERAGDG